MGTSFLLCIDFYGVFPNLVPIHSQRVCGTLVPLPWLFRVMGDGEVSAKGQQHQDLPVTYVL